MTCCFIGHRKIDDTPELRERLQSILLDLIENGFTKQNDNKLFYKKLKTAVEFHSR